MYMAPILARNSAEPITERKEQELLTCHQSSVGLDRLGQPRSLLPSLTGFTWKVVRSLSRWLADRKVVWERKRAKDSGRRPSKRVAWRKRRKDTGRNGRYKFQKKATKQARMKKHALKVKSIQCKTFAKFQR